MTPEQQIEKIQNDIEGILNDFEFGISEKDETIVLLRNYVYERAEIAVKNYKRSLPVEAQVKHANGVYSMNECIFQYCPTPDLCKKENKCLKCRHLNIVKYCKNCNMDIHDETMSDCLVCREKLVTKCEDCLEILD